MKIPTTTILTLVLAATIWSCNTQQREVSPGGDQASAGSINATSMSKYREQITSLKGKIKRHEASIKEMLGLCEAMLKDREIQRDQNSLGETYFQYGIYLEGDGQFDKAEEYTRKAERILESDDTTRMQPGLASIYINLAKIYQDRKQYSQEVSTLQYIINNFQGVAAPQLKQKEHYSGFATRMLGDYYANAHLYKEGIAGLTAIRGKYPGSLTAHIALAQMYNLQMEAGDTTAAVVTRQQVERETQQHDDYRIGSDDILQQWDAVKKGAILHKE